MHEYNVIGNSKPKIYYYMVIFSIALSSFVPKIVKVFSNITGISITITISSALIYTGLYFLIERVFWKIPIFGIPNFSGDWICSGTSNKYNSIEKHEWSGMLHIKQTWKKILISLDTVESKSISISLSGSIIKLPGIGYKLNYLYSNNPRPESKDLHSHIGHCQIIFDEKISNGNASYFTNQERSTYGSMTLKRK